MHPLCPLSQGPSNSKNSIFCSFFPQAPSQHGGTKGKSSQVLGGCCLASELCYLSKLSWMQQWKSEVARMYDS